MRELRPAPVDKLGVPLPIIPSENLPKLKVGDPELTRHHEFYLYGQDKFQKIGNIAMRRSRILRSEHTVHNNGPGSFHRFYNISKGPEDERGQFNICLLSLAGYIPKEGVDLWSGEPEIRELETGERDILTERRPGDDTLYRNLFFEIPAARKFFRMFVLKQELGAAEPQAVDEFLSAHPKISLMRNSGPHILQTAVSAAVGPIKDSYTQLHENSLLHPLAPVDPETVVLKTLGKQVRRERMYPKLRNNLVEQFPEAKAA